MTWSAAARLRSRGDVVEFGPGEADPAVLAVLVRACRGRRRVVFDYVAADGAVTARRVEPYRLVAMGGRWYLVAYDTGRSDWRSFRVDRLAAPRTVRGRFRARPLPGGGAVAYLRDGLARLPSGDPVQLRVAAPEARVREVVGRWGSVTPDGDATVVRMRSRSAEWPLVALAVLGAAATVSPPELVERAHAWAATLGEVRVDDRAR